MENRNGAGGVTLSFSLRIPAFGCTLAATFSSHDGAFRIMNFLALFLQTSTDTTSTQVQQVLMMAIPIILLICVVAVAIIIIPFWFICKKAGFSPWLSMLNLIPAGNLILLYVLAFAEWKVMPIPQQAYFPPPPGYPPQPPQPPYPPPQS